MPSEKHSKLLASYQRLSAEQQMILKLLAVYYGYASPTFTADCIKDTGLRDANGKAFKPADIQGSIQQLLKDKLLEQLPKQSSYRCHRMLVEQIARQLIDDNEFERYAKIIEQHAPIGTGYYRYMRVDDCLRDARIQYYRRDFSKVRECLTLGNRYGQIASYFNVYLEWLLNPFDAEWFLSHIEFLPDEISGYIGLHQLVYLYADPEIDRFLQQQCQAETTSNDSLLVRTYAELQLLRGEWDALSDFLVNREDPELLAIDAALTFFKGDLNGAFVQYENALKALKKLTGKRNCYFFGLAGIFYPLVILKSDQSAQRAKLPALLAQAIKTQGYWTEVYRYLNQFQQFIQGDVKQRDSLLALNAPYKTHRGFSDKGEPESVYGPSLLLQVFLILTKFWTKSEHFAHVSDQSHDLYKQLDDNGYRWPAAELAKVFSHIDPSKAIRWDTGFFNRNPLALADLFVSRPDWDLALDALLHLNSVVKKPGALQQTEKPIRLIWLVTFTEQTHGLIIEPREQKQQAKGGWSKGRAVSLKRLYTERSSFDYLTEYDLKLCSTIKEYRDNGWYASSYIDFSPKMPLALIGHPLLFWASSPEVRIEVVKGEAELRVSKLAKSDKIRISLNPLASLNQTVYITKETPTRLKVIELNEDYQKIASVLSSKGLEVPLSAQERVLQTLTSISGVLTVHSDIGGSSSTAEQVEADATPRVHLLPLGDGLRVALLIRPFATEGAYYQPGQGGESVLAEIDGKPLQAKRNLSLEKKRSKAILDACPGLQEAERDVAGDFLLEEPEQCLELLLQLQALPEGQAILEWPEGVKFRVLGQNSGSGFTMQIKRDNDWFALQGELKVNEDTVLEIQHLLGLLSGSQGRFLKLKDGQFIALTDAFRKRLDDLKAYADISGKKVRINPLAALTLEDWDDATGTVKSDKHWQEHLQRLKNARDYQPVLPSTFQAELRDYQLDGFIWLARLAQWGVGACLADDMGLGKTVQGLALLVDRAPKGPSLIVAPTSVCMNWEIEARRFAPTLNPQLLGTGDRQKLLDDLGPYDLLICSYGMLQQEQVADMLAKIRFQTLILDEAQAIKNTATRRSQGAMSLQGDFKLIMTGTPLENHLGELWNLFRFINPGLLGSMEQFNQRFAGPIERDRNTQAKQQLKKLIQPFILRRTKTQVLQELPPRTEIPIYVEMSSEEMAFYEALRRDSLATLVNTEGQPPGQKHLQILAAISKLRRSCCNTRLANPDISLPSSKLAAFGEIVDELLDNKHKALVFSQFVDHLHLIKEYVEGRDIKYQYLDGSTPAKERQKRVDAFQRGEGELFLISLKAGGVGLNLTAADYVIHMDPWWNPAVEDQASDRAHRMGQQRPVTIYRMIAKQTIEEKIVALHSHKRDLADSLLDGADISGKMSADDLLSLMKSEG
ncbi:MAG: DEAD/DEAH box helicase [Methylomicrobium sp.]|nr:DEAD/DEAH box helicase [Methylomicrobium sp.]